MIETLRGIAWLVATLRANSAFTVAVPGGVSRGIAPQAATYPLAIVGFQGGADVHGSNQARLWNDGLYLVKVVGPSDDIPALEAGADATDAALQDQSGTSSDGGVIMTCLREQPFGPSEELVDGVRYTSVGGLYRLLVRPS